MISIRARFLVGAALLATMSAAYAAMPPSLWKFKDWVAYGAGATDPLHSVLNVDGMAMVRVSTNSAGVTSTEISIVVHGLRPNVEYSVMLTRISGEDSVVTYNNVQAFTTNSKGKGMFVHTIDGGEGGVDTWTPRIDIYKWDGVLVPLVPGEPEWGAMPDDEITEQEARAFTLPAS